MGRGLSALIATGDSVGGLKFEELPTSAIRPSTHQPRRSFPEAGIQELAASIREVGILQPLVVRSTDGGFELIAGERRLRAAKEAGLERVPVLIRQAGDNESMELALVENLQREDLNPLETAAAYQTLMEGFGLTKEQLAHRLGKSRAAVTNTLRLAQLPEPVRAMLRDGKLSEGHARARSSQFAGRKCSCANTSPALRARWSPKKRAARRTSSTKPRGSCARRSNSRSGSSRCARVERSRSAFAKGRNWRRS